MVIMFAVKESRTYLEANGFVYTLRPYKRKTGHTWYNYFPNDIERGDVLIIFIGDFSLKEKKLEPYVKESGFESLEKWLIKAKNARYLYMVVIK